ncbi:MAG: ATP-binding protein [Nitrospiraceae bacterium]|nr:ATP-binding protein [Nitrospiraceae bacterium]
MNFSDIDPMVMTPDQAMQLPDDGKLAYFRKVRVKHPRVATILDDLETMVLPESGTDIALLIGPTGAGKSTLGASLLERIIKLHKDEMTADLSFIPAVMISAPSSGEDKFSWRIFYVKLGTALIEPLLDKKQPFRLQDGRISVRHVTTGSTVAGLRVAVEDALRYRRTLLVIIDEAVHLIRGTKGGALAAHMDALKALTILDGVTLTLALIGSYDLYQLMCLSGQLARRSAIVHFQRYTPGVAEDEKAFKKSIEKLQKYMPLRDVPDLSQMSAELMDSCIGCVGTLKETLQRALTFALRNKGKWTDACLAKALLTERQITAILEETLQGEEDIAAAVFGTGHLGFKPEIGKKAA